MPKQNAASTPDQIVFADMTQAELDRQYDQSTLVPNVADYVGRWNAMAEGFRASGAIESHSYGPAPVERLDIYTTACNRPGVHMHIHGGAWRSLSRQTAGFAASGLVSLGQPVAVVGFGLAPGTHITDMVVQVRRAFLWLRCHHGRVTVSGHSSGGHLSACLLDKHWWTESGLAPSDFGAVLMASGLYDLAPVRLSKRNDYLALTSAEEDALSPIRNLPDALPPVAVVRGDGELREFARQAEEMAQALHGKRADTVVEVLAGQNHFDIYDQFGEEGSPICAVLRHLAHLKNIDNNREMKK